MIYNVASEYIECLRKCTNSLGRFVQLKYNKLIKTETKFKEWVDNTNLSPILLHRLIIKANKTSFEYPILCPVCGKPLSERQILDGQKFCSRQCTFKCAETKDKITKKNIEKYGVARPAQNKDIMAKMEKTKEAKYGDKHFTNAEKRKRTNLERYGNEYAIATEAVQAKIKESTRAKFGVDNVFNSPEIRQKIQDTCKERYGYNTPLESQEIRDKIAETNKEKYGVENPLGNKEVRKKIEKTNLERYGYKNPTQNEKIKEKVIQTNLSRFGVEHASQLPEYQTKQEETNLAKYGVRFLQQSEEIREKSENSCLKKYGVKNYKQSEIATVQHREKYWDKFVSLLKKKYIEPQFTKDEYIKGDCKKFKCILCHNEFESNDLNVQHIHCEVCMKKPYSKKEKDVVSFLRTFYNGEIIENDRTILEGKELDIYILEKKIAIEFNGNYWHSLEYKPSGYHQEKSLECQKRGIRLIHIFEWEWDTKRDKIESLLKNVLGLYDEVIYARDTEFKEITSTEYSDFLLHYHLQGAVNSEHRFALFYRGSIVSVMGIGKSRFNGNEIELHRYCVKSGVRVVGGFSKLLKNAMDCIKINRLVSYVDIGHFDGSGYKAVGFKEIGLTTPNYVYVNEERVLSRYQCQKHRLPQLLGEGYCPELTEWENMYINGFAKIEDCGNYKFEYER